MTMSTNDNTETSTAAAMPQQIIVGYKALLAEAEQEIDQLSVEDAMALAGQQDVAIIDIRDVRELWRDGRIPGSVHVPRGMLEFWIDPQSPYHKPLFAEDMRFIFHCAGGLRSALATQIAQRMGLKPVFNMIGGFSAWKEAGGPVEAVEPKKA
jgi:rhodanese-related sulfurtransferase